ncbi:MAG TPA: ABC transporter substrate-binding protein [Stellaceae bacterium]|jgi:ABC transporter substrate binding protein (PQQ-dependent alcohol dehydrogenase system)|nr:ABC transporter substrate-binding protein [Stellaceae bacterium]
MTGVAPRLLLLVLLVMAPLAAARADQQKIQVGWLSQTEKRSWPLSYLDQPPADEGIEGARLGIDDDNTTGNFTGQSFDLVESVAPESGDVAAAFRDLTGKGVRLVVTDLPAAALLKVADLPEAKEVTIFNTAAPDDRLRAQDCRANVLHLPPSRAMLADALVQYLVFKRWKDLLVVEGKSDGDQEFAADIRHAAAKFQARIVAEKPWTFIPGARRTDTGHFAIEAEVARFTQGIGYDVLVVADEADDFGDYLSYRTTDPRPVAGTQGLVPTAWARPFEQWGATQLQNRFLRLAKRWMTDRDYAAWMAVRAIGEAATRAKSADPAAIMGFMRSPRFELAAYKGARLSFRSWDGQLRQPVLLADPRSLVSVSPQKGFLHQFSELDTLGIDQPETKCRMK